ncbi:MAG: envelope integrity protein Cei [Mycobacterium sp.]
MVAHITEGTAFDKRGLPFRRRNIWPGIIVAAVLAIVTGLIWTLALTRPPEVVQAAVCNPPPEPTDPATPRLGEKVPSTEMARVEPARLAETKISVLNASGRGGQAGEVSGELRDLGFAQPTAANDPIYAGAQLTCQGQIRFGPAGEASAAAVWLVAPCTELFRDERESDSVDLVIGTDFTTLTHSDDINAVLTGLQPDATEPSDPALLTKIHSATC